MTRATMKVPRSRAASATAVLVAAALVTGACSGDDAAEAVERGADATEPAAEATASETATEAGESTGDDADTGDDMAADDTADPVKIGLIAQDEELIAFPEIRSVAQTMADYFNAEQGGIDGHPIELQICGSGDTPESAGACAQEFANADDVHVVINGSLNTAASNEVLTGAGKPVLTLNNDVADMLTPGAFAIDPGSLGIAQAMFIAAADAGAKTLTFFYADDPFYEAFIPVIELMAENLGMTVNENIPLGFEPDLTGPVSAADLDSDLWVVAMADGAQCSAAANAARTVGYEGRLTSSDVCFGEDAVTSGDLDGWYGPAVTGLATVGGKDADEFARILDTYGDDAATPFSLGGWAAGNVSAAREVLITAGGADATDESVLETLESYESDTLIGYPSVKCPGPGSFVSACDTSVMVYQAVDGALVADGFVDLDFSAFEILLEG